MESTDTPNTTEENNEHTHVFMPRFACDYQDNCYEWGECECGEKDM